MRWAIPGCVLAAALLLPLPQPPARAEEKDGFKPLFNGKDLKGWVRVNTAPKTFYVKDNEIITTGVPTGYLRTDKMYENFIMEFEWKHIPPNPKAVGNSGLFVWCDPLPALGTGYSRAIEVQVLVNLTWKDEKGAVTASSHGDLFSIHGAKCVPDRPHPRGWERCIPSENRAKGAGEWNHYRVEANDGVIKLAVNGKVVSGVSKCKPRKGYLALEAEGSECHFRNLKIKELPSTNPKPDEVCAQGRDFVTLFTGLDLDGWKVGEDDKSHWKVNSGDNSLRHAGKDKGALTTEKQFADFEFVCDCRLPADGRGELLLRGSEKIKVDLAKGTGGKWNRFRVALKGEQLSVFVNGKKIEDKKLTDVPAKGPITLAPDGAAEFMSLFARELK
jgi:Domain of Unknown Function (DUF1080)